jgi:hypothetical protein
MAEVHVSPAKQALEYAQKPGALKHWVALATDFGGLSKFNMLKAQNLTFLLGAGMLVRFFGIGGTRIAVDWNDKTKDEETRRRQTAERVFVEVAGTWIATYMALQLGMDVSGKALGGLAHLAAPPLEKLARNATLKQTNKPKQPFHKLMQWVLKPRSMNPMVLLEKAQALKAEGKLCDKDIDHLAEAVVRTTGRKNPFSFGLNSAERNALGNWNSTQFSKALESVGGKHLYHEAVQPNNTIKTSGLLNDEQWVENYFARTNVAGVASSIIGGVFSAWLSGGPIQRANDVVFRPWYLHRLKLAEEKKKHALEASSAPTQQPVLDATRPNAMLRRSMIYPTPASPVSAIPFVPAYPPTGRGMTVS